MRNKRFPKYPGDTDYTTNSPSYYDDLARKNKLIELLSKRIWVYEETLDLTLEEIKNRLESYIFENDELMTERLEQWDLNLEKFPENVELLLQEWLQDGTLDHIINETIFNWKADKTYVDAEIERLDQKDEDLTTLKADKTFVDSEIERLDQKLEQIAYYIPSGSSADYIQNILDNAVDGSELLFEQGGNFSLDKTIKFGLRQNRITINGNGSIVRFTHGGDGFDLESELYDFGSHRLLNMHIIGGNEEYPEPDYIPTNTGAGVRLIHGYFTVLRDLTIKGFGTGLYIKNGIKNRVEGNTYILRNQIGIHIDGGATNANNFYGISIRENSIRGVLIEGHPGVDAHYPTRNNFDGCVIESNIPYPYVSTDFPNDSVGVEIKHAFDNYFTGTYFENHEVAIYISDNSDGNYFGGSRFNPGGFEGARQDKIVFGGMALRNNTFENNQHLTTDEPNVVLLDDAMVLNTRFINCSGLKFSKEDYENMEIDIINARSSINEKGDRLSVPYNARDSRLSNIQEGIQEGQISGIGTDNAVINARGYGELTLGSLITGDTTIVDIDGLRVGQFFVLTNHQVEHSITLKNGQYFNELNLKDRKDVVLTEYNDTIVFYRNNHGRIVEVGRSIKDVNIQTGSAVLPANEKVIVVEHKLNTEPKFVSVTPNGFVGSVIVDTINSNSFTIRSENSRTMNTVLNWLAEI